MTDAKIREAATQVAQLANALNMATVRLLGISASYQDEQVVAMREKMVAMRHDASAYMTFCVNLPALLNARNGKKVTP